MIKKSTNSTDNQTWLNIDTIIMAIIGCVIGLFGPLFSSDFCFLFLPQLIVLVVVGNFIIMSTLRERRYGYMMFLVLAPILFCILMPTVSLHLSAYGRPLHNLHNSLSEWHPYREMQIIFYYIVGAGMSLVSLIMVLVMAKKKPKRITKQMNIRPVKNRLINKILPIIFLILLVLIIVLYLKK